MYCICRLCCRWMSSSFWKKKCAWMDSFWGIQIYICSLGNKQDPHFMYTDLFYLFPLFLTFTYIYQSMNNIGFSCRKQLVSSHGSYCVLGLPFDLIDWLTESVRWLRLLSMLFQTITWAAMVVGTTRFHSMWFCLSFQNSISISITLNLIHSILIFCLSIPPY